MRNTAITATLCAVILLMANIARAAETLRVVELFTSQSCSSCPAADKVLEKLAAEENTIALACHVTYWNHLQWRDPLSQQFCTSRQTGYATLLPGRSIFTPQIVVNGTQGFIGSHEYEVTRALKNATPVIRIPMRRGQDGSVGITLPDIGTDAPLTLWLFGMKNRHTQSIPSGENAGRTITYINTATFVQKSEDWDGRPAQRQLTLPADQEADRLILLVQKDRFGAIIAAGQIDLQ